MRRGDSQCPLLVKARVHRGKKGGVHFWVFLILTFCNFNWLEKEAIYNPAIYSWLHWYSWPGRWHLNEEHLMTVRPVDDFTPICCAVWQASRLCHQSLSQLPALRRWCLGFCTARLSQNFSISRAITASQLFHTYPIMLLSPHPALLFYFLLSATGSELPPLRWCLSAWCLRAPLGKWEGRASICVHVVRGKTTPKHVSEQEAS